MYAFGRLVSTGQFVSHVLAAVVNSCNIMCDLRTPHVHFVALQLIQLQPPFSMTRGSDANHATGAAGHETARGSAAYPETTDRNN
ncbi:hypothetical protein BDY21DRAFT_335145 [Lineolata rhizophorae]|uniref:Uncharacterized protein n=1 Tax=Lineolata rhizophorae TaxID=578093 RepID=A0A6A6P905_9PEZI|nr:hypothetical protein BDY21DRAFT_335145 [Lineolata rhizophorae]